MIKEKYTDIEYGANASIVENKVVSFNRTNVTIQHLESKTKSRCFYKS